MHQAGIAASMAGVIAISTGLDPAQACETLGWIGTGFVLTMFGG